VLGSERRSMIMEIAMAMGPMPIAERSMTMFYPL